VYKIVILNKGTCAFKKYFENIQDKKIKCYSEVGTDEVSQITQQASHALLVFSNKDEAIDFLTDYAVLYQINFVTIIIDDESTVSEDDYVINEQKAKFKTMPINELIHQLGELHA
jgi:hypothetical protein